VWPLEVLPKTVRRAYVYSPQGRNEVFLTCGSREELDAIAEAARKALPVDASVEMAPVEFVTTADGVEVELQVARSYSRLLGGSTMVYVLGIGRRGNRIFLVNAGAKQRYLDLEALHELIGRIRLPY
jgi:hypothetical protein